MKYFGMNFTPRRKKPGQKGAGKMYSICIKFKKESNWRPNVRQFSDFQEVIDYLNEKWEVWPVSHAFVFEDGRFKQKYMFSPAACERMHENWERFKANKRRLYGNFVNR